MDANKRVKEDPLTEATNVVAEFHITGPTDRRSQIIAEYNTCVLCGSDLEFTHITQFIRQEVTEEARCPSCNIRHKKEMHRLQ